MITASLRARLAASEAYAAICAEAEEYVLSLPPHLFAAGLDRRFDQVSGAWDLAMRCSVMDLERPMNWLRRVEARMAERSAA